MADKKKDEKAEKRAIAKWKLDLYCLHVLMCHAKKGGISDVKIWSDIKDLFESKDYNLEMQLRPVAMVWGDTSHVDKFIKEHFGIEITKGKTDSPSSSSKKA